MYSRLGIYSLSGTEHTSTTIIVSDVKRPSDLHGPWHGSGHYLTRCKLEMSRHSLQNKQGKKSTCGVSGSSVSSLRADLWRESVGKLPWDFRRPPSVKRMVGQILVFSRNQNGIISWLSINHDTSEDLLNCLYLLYQDWVLGGVMHYSLVVSILTLTTHNTSTSCDGGAIERGDVGETGWVRRRERTRYLIWLYTNGWCLTNLTLFTYYIKI